MQLGTAEAKPERIPTAHFAARSAIMDAKISPDGNAVSFIRRVEGAQVLVVARIDPFQVLRRSHIPEGADIEWYRWAGPDKLLVSVSAMGAFFGEQVRYTRLLLLYPQEGKTQFLFDDFRTVIGDDVIFLPDDGSYALVAIQKSIYDWPSVFRHELKPGGEVVEVQREKEGVSGWYADDGGVVRMGTGWRNRRLRIYYRPDAGSDFKLIGKIKPDETDRFWDVAQIVSGSDQGYVLDEDENGRVGLRLFDYAKREVIETYYENPDWDVEDVWLRDGKPLAAFYTDDRDRVVWFDEKYDKLYKALRNALGQESVWVTSRAENNSRMVVWAGGEADPGVLYLYTPAKQQLEELAQIRPEVDYRLLARPKPISYSARDGTKISAYLTLPRGRDAKNLPLIILPHGGPYGVRDKLAYDDEVQLLANRGYAVLQPNYRGSGGYGDAFFELGNGQIGRGMQDDIDDAMDWAVGQGVADPARVCVIGSSYGGYAALWAVIRNPERYRCAASWAGVTDWERMLRYDRRFLTGKGNKKWRQRVEGQEKFDLDLVSPYRQAAKLTRPILLAHGTKDSRVPFTQFKRLEKELRGTSAGVTTLVIEDEGHSFSKEENEQKWYDALEAFLAAHNPAE